MKTYTVTVICEITKQYTVRAANDQQAETIALSRFDTTTRHGIKRTGSTAGDAEIWQTDEKPRAPRNRKRTHHEPQPETSIQPV